MQGFARGSRIARIAASSLDYRDSKLRGTVTLIALRQGRSCMGRVATHMDGRCTAPRRVRCGTRLVVCRVGVYGALWMFAGSTVGRWIRDSWVVGSARTTSERVF